MKLRLALYLAIKSLQRSNRLLALLTIAMMSLVYLNLIYPSALLNGLIEGTNKRLRDTWSANVIVQPVGGKSHIEGRDELQTKIVEVRGVEAVAAHTQVSAEIRHADDFGIWEINSIQPEQEAQVFGIKPALIEGEYLSPDDTDQILLGIQIAGADRKNIELYTESLKTVHAGDKVTVKYPNGTQTGLERIYTVKGIFREQFIQSDIRAFVTDKELTGLFPQAKNKATNMFVKTSGRNEAEVADELSYVHSGLRFVTWQQKAGVIKTMTESFAAINQVLGLIALSVAIITILGVTFIDLARKRHQLAVERAIGIPSATIVLAQLIRGFIFAVVGVAIATAAFVLIISPYQEAHPFAFPAGDVSLVWTNAFLLKTASILMLVSVCSALLPALQAVKIKLIDAIAKEE